MDARTPPPIRLQDLDRDELLRLAQRFAFGIRPRDMWWARWEALNARSDKADAACRVASEAWSQLIQRDVSKLSARALAAHQVEKAKAWAAYQAASSRADRAWKAVERAYKAYSAHPAGA